MKIQNHVLRTGIACAVALWILAGCSSPEERAKAYYESGMHYVDSKDYTKAAIEFRNALKINENMADAWYGMAIVEQQASAWDRSYADLVKALEIEPKHQKALIAISALLGASGDKKAALKYTDTALSIEPQNADIIAQKASLLYQLGQTQEGVGEAKKALALKPNHPGASIVLASDAIKTGDVPGALKIVDAALAEQPKVLGLHLVKLVAAKTNNDLGLQEKTLRTLVSTFPEIPQYRAELLSFLTANNRKDDAEKELRAALQSKPEDTKIAMELVAFIDQTKGHAAARGELVALSSKAQNAFPYLLAIAELDFQDGRADDAEKQLRDLSQSKGVTDEGIQAMLVLNSQLIARNKTAEAEAGIAEVLKHDGENPDALKQRAGLLINQGTYEPAIQDLRSVLTNAKGDIKALALLAAAYERNGQMELAESTYADAAQGNLNDPAFALDYVSFLIRRGKQEQAQTALLAIVERFPANRNALLMLAEMYQRNGDWERATEVGQRLQGGNTAADPASNMIVAQSLLAQRRYDDVIKLLGGGEAKPGTNAAEMKSLVQAYVAANRASDANAYLDSILKDNPKNSNAMVLQSALLRRDGKLQEAAQRLDDAIKVEPESFHPYMALSSLYDSQNNLDKSLATLQQGLGAAKEKAPLRFALAVLYERAARPEDAISTYETLRTEMPDSMVVTNNLASLLTDNRSDQASLDRAATLAKVLKDSPVAEFRETLGWALFSSGKQKEGVRLMEGSIEALDKLPMAHVHLATGYVALKKNDLAKKHFNAALLLNPPAAVKANIEKILPSLN